MERVVGRAGETDFPENQLMRTRQQATLSRALSTARRQFDQWRSRHRKRVRLPEELWRQAAALAREHHTTSGASTATALKRHGYLIYTAAGKLVLGLGYMAIRPILRIRRRTRL